MTGLAIGERIRALRVKRGLTQDQLAAKARLSRIYIAKLEGGERMSPSFPALVRIARAVGAKLRIELTE